MLDDWERGELDAIEQDLSRDRSLSLAFAPATPRQRRHRTIRRWAFPRGFLASALAYQLAVMGQLRWLVGIAALTGLAGWLVLELRSLPPGPQVSTLERWFGRWW